MAKMQKVKPNNSSSAIKKGTKFSDESKFALDKKDTTTKKAIKGRKTDAKQMETKYYKPGSSKKAKDCDHY